MTAAGRAEQDGLSIGAVLSQLRLDFPDITISKIRFLEAEGLVQPARTPSGYRQFTAADVERLRFVLSAQRDHYLPLKVIKEQLDAVDNGQAPAELGPKPPRRLVSVDDGVPSADDFAPSRVARMTREEMLAQADIDSALLAELERYGLVKPGAAGFYDSEALLVAQTAKSMTEFGIEPRHLRAFRASADREVGLLEQIVTPMYRQRGPESFGRADEVVHELAALSVRLHALLIRAGLRESRGQ